MFGKFKGEPVTLDPAKEDKSHTTHSTTKRPNMVFYPGNVKRATRLQQLLNSMENMQTDIKSDAKNMTEKTAAMKSKVDEMLKENNIETIDQLIEKSTAKLTAEEKKQFEALIAAAKASKSGFDWAYMVATILMVPEGVILTSKAIMALGRFVVRISAVVSVAKFFKAAEAGASATAAASRAAQELEKAALEAELAAKEAGVAGKAGLEVSEAAKIMARVSKFMRVLGVVGFVVTIVIGIVEAVEGAKQKEELVKAIQGSQPARLCIAYFKRESTNIIQQLTLITSYLNYAVGENKNPVVAAALAGEIVKNINVENSKINWTALEEEYEAQDRVSGSFYGGDDLSKAEVVKRAQEGD